MAKTSRTRFKGSVAERLLHYSMPITESGCLIWLGALNEDGYGPHRLAYETFVGPIPAGLEIDHLCRVRCCINVLHMEPITHAENVRRGNSGIHLSSRTHCGYGHEFTVENTAYAPGTHGRVCKECHRLAKLRYLEKKRLTAPVKVKDYSNCGRYLRERTHCNYGHPFTPENTIIRDNGRARRCRQCHGENIKRRLQRERLALIELEHSKQAEAEAVLPLNAQQPPEL